MVNVQFTPIDKQGFVVGEPTEFSVNSVDEFIEKAKDVAEIASETGERIRVELPADMPRAKFETFYGAAKVMFPQVIKNNNLRYSKEPSSIEKISKMVDTPEQFRELYSRLKSIEKAINLMIKSTGYTIRTYIKGGSK